MLDVATNSDLTYDTDTSTLSATQYSGTLLGDVTGLQGTPSITVQDITAEQLSVAGTISYGSIDNENSVGVITANKGIKVPDGGVVVTGVITATSYQGDGSGLSGIELGTQSFVASGTIPNGATVVINTDGTVGIVTLTTISTSAGTPVVFDDTTVTYKSAIYDSTNGKVVIAYRDWDNSNYGTAIVGTVSGTSISFGTPVVFNTGTTDYISSTYDSASGKVVIAYRDSGNSNYGTAIVGTVSGTSISFGSEVVFNSGITIYVGSTYDSTNGKVVIVYRDDGNSNRGTAIVGTVSGTSISFGSEVVFNSANTQFAQATYDSTNQKVVIVYNDGGNSDHGTAIVGTVSGTSISFGSEVVFNSDVTFHLSCTYDSTNGKVVIAYQDSNNSSFGTAIVGTVSGTSISFGSEVVFESASTSYTSAIYDSTEGKVVIAYADAGNSNYGTAIVGTVSGTSISFGTAVVFNSAASNYNTSAYDSTNQKVVIASAVSAGTAVVFTTGGSSTNLTAENFIGIAAETISNGATGKITVVSGTNSSQTGLTTARKYYVQQGGTLGLTADTPSVVAGTSVSSTKIAIQKS
jgi:hypothetical protein